MHRVTRWLLAAVVGLAAATALPTPALARKAKVEWKAVEGPSGGDHDRTLRTLRAQLTKAARKADFGKAKSVALSARVIEFTSVTQGDVHRVSCTVLGRVVGGPSARSRISFGGRPSEREALEKQVLTMVASGVVGRLAQIVRTREEEAAQDD